MPQKPMDDYFPNEDDMAFLTKLSALRKFVIPIKAQIKKIGTSSGIIIPNQVREYLGFQVGDKVYVFIEHQNKDDEGDDDK